MINYKTKAYVLSTDLAFYERKFSKFKYYADSIISRADFEQRDYTEEEAKQLKDYVEQMQHYKTLAYDNYGVDFDIDEYEHYVVKSLNNNFTQRKNRLRNKIEKMLEQECLFLTFTFEDKYIDSSVATKRKYVQRMLNDLGVHYVANIDYGKKYERVHFHAVVQIDFIDNTDKRLWRYGALKILPVKVKNTVALSKYICKLTNHAIKNTTKGNRCMFDRLKEDMVV